MRIDGKCHCGNISYTFDWPGDGAEIPVRACGCSFCMKHGGVYTSHPEARLDAVVADRSELSIYRFGTETADFHVCRRCGVMPFATSEIDGRLYAVVNVSTFDGIGADKLTRTVTNFDGETTDSRLDRRRRNWTPTVRIT